MIRYILPIIYLLISLAVEADEISTPPKIMSYNVYMLDHRLGIFVGGTNPKKRAELLANSPVFDDIDVLVFNEVFDNQASTILIDALAQQFGYRTPVLGRTKSGWDHTEGWRSTSLDDGGVILLSKYPIEYKSQVIFREGCGADWASQKGFIHAVINKNGERYNIVGTHVQADDNTCSIPPSVVRQDQFAQIENYISGANRSFDEMFFIAGDLNVAKDSQEFPTMIETLNVSEPTNYVGAPYSWDPATNGLAHANYADLKGQLLDYVFVERSHKQPKNWHNQVLDVVSKRVELPGTQEPYYFYEYSDHFPVAAFEYADESTPTQSARPQNKPYNAIRLKHQLTGQYVYADANVSNGYLTYGRDGSVPNAEFKLDNWYPYNGTCIHDHDYVQISRRDDYKDYYWTYSGSKYYTEDRDSSDFMKISRQVESDDCIQNGDVVYIYDHAHLLWASANEYLEPSDSYIKATKELPVGDNGLFIVEMDDFKFSDWKPTLTYK
ncbi:sphingomyelin phosphodiesterase [Vibrio campbellii]|uniref:sphingomyelin phosphodiesterase n=1 Tax=Vibrio campbellii TaxID=680 RepID=UPI0005312C35|nr:sphingomyelin phosphodiesterase [Vibrio campbellii]KGR34217.1 sphingomyelin phosphodiesterase [Vibrio campbellii]